MYITCIKYTYICTYIYDIYIYIYIYITYKYIYIYIYIQFFTNLLRTENEMESVETKNTT